MVPAWSIDAAALAASALFAGLTGRALLGLWRLPDLPPAPPAARRPRVSLVIPCRDGGARISEAVRRALAQREVDLEVVVVDDGSSDETPALLAGIAAADPRLSVISVAGPPPGWLGKCHALHCGAEAATGDWLLFADADVWMAPDLVARAVAFADATAADHVTLLPALADTRPLGRAWVLGMSLALLAEVARLHAPRPRGYLGMGAFNLVRRDLYRAWGGHAPLRLELIDDVRLGRLVAAHGGRTRVAMACDALEVAWIGSLASGFRLLEKNLFAAVGLRLPVAVALIVGGLGAWATAMATPWTGRPAGIAAGLALASMVLPTAGLARRYRWPWSTALWTPLVVLPLQAGALAWSAGVAVARGGVRWRGRDYPLAELRAFYRANHRPRP